MGLALAGVVIAAVLQRRKSPFAFLAAIGAVTAASLALGLAPRPTSLVSAPDFSLAFELDVLGALEPALWPAILGILLTDLFDSLSTFVAVSQAAGLVDEKGEPLRVREGLLVDALATLGAGLLGTSSGTAYIESAAGVEAGGRTGRTSVVTALCFVPLLFVGPLVAVVPPWATAPVLIVVGGLMFRAVGRLELGKLEDALPAFLAIVLIPLTFSITQGILWAFLAHVVLYVFAGRRAEVARGTWALAAISALQLVALRE